MLVVHWYIRLVNQEIHEGPLPDSTESQQLSLPTQPSPLWKGGLKGASARLGVRSRRFWKSFKDPEMVGLPFSGETS